MDGQSINSGDTARPMLFEPLTIRGLTLKNRLVPPMVHYRAEAGNTCGTFHVVHLALQLPFMDFSESMGNHDSKIVDAASVD